MQNFFDIEIDTTNMTLEEVEEALKKVRELYYNLSLQIRLRKMAEHKHSNPSD